MIIVSSTTDIGKLKTVRKAGCTDGPVCSVLHTEDGMSVFFYF